MYLSQTGEIKCHSYGVKKNPDSTNILSSLPNGRMIIMKSNSKKSISEFRPHNPF